MNKKFGILTKIDIKMESFIRFAKKTSKHFRNRRKAKLNGRQKAMKI